MDDALSLTPLEELVDVLGSVGVQAVLDPAELNPPGAWIALDTVDRFTVGGRLELGCRVFLIAPDTDPRRAFAVLADLFNRTGQVLTPDGQTVSQGVVLPGDPTPLPALAVPVNLYTNGA